MYTRAVSNDLDFFRTSKSLYESVKDKELVLLPITMDLTLDDVSYPFVLPRTRDVVNVFAKNYRAACGERLVVTSAARPRSEQPRNASPQSVHPTGMAVDFRKPSGTCLTFLRAELVRLERQGVLEATEEKHPVHFHVAVLQRGRFAPAAPAVATATTATPTQTQLPAGSSPTVSASSATTMDSAGGSVAIPSSATRANPSRAAKSSTYLVKKGDTLSGIAKRFGLTVARLKTINGLKGSTIRPGQKLRVS
jgi:LysM repeat protein